MIPIGQQREGPRQCVTVIQAFVTQWPRLMLIDTKADRTFIPACQGVLEAQGPRPTPLVRGARLLTRTQLWLRVAIAALQHLSIAFVLAMR